MFIKSTRGTDLIQSVLFGLGVAAIAVLFVAGIQAGFNSSSTQVTNVTNTMGDSLGNTVDGMLP